MTLNEQVSRFLSAHTVINLATIGESGPWSSAVFYVFENGRFYFLSAAHTRHCRNLAADSRVAATIQKEVENWQEIKGMQLEGHAYQIEPAEVNAVIDLYAKRFPVTGPDAPVEIARALDKISWYQLEPTRLLFIDNERGLGHRDEIDPANLV